MAPSHAVLALLVLCGCGGGMDSGIEPIYLEYGLEGEVSSRDGAPANLAGILVECLETGESDVTDAGGRFRLRLESNGALLQQVTIRFVDPARTGPPDPSKDPSEADDGDEDGLDVRADAVVLTVPPAASGSGASVLMRVALEDGSVSEVGIEVAGDEGGGAPRAGEGRLAGFQLTTADTAAGAEVEVAIAGACSSLEIEVDKIVSSKGPLDVRLTAPTGDEASLGPLLLDADGQGHFATKSCAGDPLPFGATSVDDLAGWPISVVDGAGKPLFQGKVPAAGID